MFFLLCAMFNPVALFANADVAIAVTALALAKISEAADPWSARRHRAASMTRLARRLPAGRILLRMRTRVDRVPEVP